MTQPVVLAVGLASDSTESVALYHALKTFTFRSTGDIYIGGVSEYIAYRKGVTQFKLLSEVRLELDDLVLRCGSCLCKMPLQRRAGVLFFHFVIGKLYSGITIFLYCTNLRNNTRTSLNYGAWDILPISTENGSHSDFLSN